MYYFEELVDDIMSDWNSEQGERSVDIFLHRWYIVFTKAQW